MKAVKNTNPWFYADGRDYITPEDITAAITSGGEKLEIWKVVLDAVSAGACEDTSCCAFVASKFEKDKMESDV